MGQIYTFHKSVMGQSHVSRNIPCEDASGSFTAEDGRYHIAIVSDGHGQKRSFRSQVGSQIAVDVTLECLKEFAEAMLSTPETAQQFQQDMLHHPRYRQTTVRRLTDTILAGWIDRIHADYEANPPAPEEIGEFADYYQDSGKLSQIYGATLMAALRFSECMVLFHQGDGRCDVFYADGSVDQPIPWDERCQGNRTTSLCDTDAADSFRHCVIDLNQRPVAACYLGSDGVEDAYREEEGTHTFYRDLSCKLMEKSHDEFMAYLNEMLPVFSAWGMFSKVGSQDDVSVSGIVDRDAMQMLIPAFQRQIRRFELSEALFWEEDALRSKMRAHGILQKRLQEAVDKLERAKCYLERLERELDEIKSHRQTVQTEITQTEMTIQQEKQGYEEFQGYLQSDREPEDTEVAKIIRYIKKYPQALKAMLMNLSNMFTSYQADHDRLQREDQELQSRIEAKNRAVADARAAVAELQAQADQAQAAFDEYDIKYQAIANEIESLKAQIAQLDNPDSGFDWEVPAEND
jgi:hypothetical protein